MKVSKAILGSLMSRTLYGLRQSPWTERACWALDHHGLVFEYHEHVPMVGELLLRRKARIKQASVPLLADGDDVVMGSFEIAKHAEKAGRGAPLFPRDKDNDVAHWADIAERMNRVGRAWVMKRMLASRAAQAEALPPFVPGPLRGALSASSGMAIKFLARKWNVPEDVDAEVEHTLRPLLEEAREAIEDGGYVLSRLGLSFTYADIALAATMQVVRPRETSTLGPATREAWTNAALARDFEDLLAWRDAIYGKHR